MLCAKIDVKDIYCSAFKEHEKVKESKRPSTGPVYYIHKTGWWADEMNCVICTDTDHQNIWTEKSKAQNYIHIIIQFVFKDNDI